MIKNNFFIIFFLLFYGCYIQTNTPRTRHLNVETRLYNYPYVWYGPQPNYLYVYPKPKPVLVQPPRKYYHGPRRK